MVALVLSNVQQNIIQHKHKYTLSLDSVPNGTLKRLRTCVQKYFKQVINAYITYQTFKFHFYILETIISRTLHFDSDT